MPESRVGFSPRRRKLETIIVMLCAWAKAHPTNVKKNISVILILLAIYPVNAQSYRVLDYRFFSCKAANAAGIFNVPTPRYYVPKDWNHTSDRDGDGISCEPKRKRTR